jgi:2,3-bisphosphoglycerate-independent phosphoglycerate mutase
MQFHAQIPSDKVIFNEKPDMKAREITEAGKEALKSGRYQMVRINYANPDMVGHTGEREGERMNDERLGK